ncbi:MAG: DUF1080 domain-containing protein [Planctomycetota bacterium]
MSIFFRQQKIVAALVSILVCCSESGIQSHSTDVPKNPQEHQKQKPTTDDQDKHPDSGAQESNESEKQDLNWTPLFDGKSTAGWEGIEFGGEGEFAVRDGMLHVGAGDPLTGFSSTRQDIPKSNYEVSLEARKMDGIDFFCGLTFPVKDSHCTFIVGGWGGSTVGLSCIDDVDASSNETGVIWDAKFNKNQWYKIRVRILDQKIVAWIDDRKAVDVDITNKKISLRGDTTLCTPLGVCTFETSSDIRNFKIRSLKTNPNQQK